MTTTIPTRDELAAFPCPTRMHNHVLCHGDCSWRVMCEVRPIYDAHIKLLALRAAVLGDMVPGEAGDLYRMIASQCGRVSLVRSEEHLNALADVVVKL